MKQNFNQLQQTLMQIKGPESTVEVNTTHSGLTCVVYHNVSYILTESMSCDQLIYYNS